MNKVSLDKAIAITGIGVVSPLGFEIETLARALEEGQCCLRSLTLFDTGIKPTPIVAQIDDPLEVVAKPGFRLSRTDRMAITAAHNAINQLSEKNEKIEDIGILMGGTVGGLENVHPSLIADPLGFYRRRSFSKITSFQCGHVTDAVAAYLGLCGPRLSISAACASGAMAIALGASMIQSGRTRRVIAGGSDALCPMTISGFNSLQAMSADPCRPFDQEREGMNIGEGAAALFLEDVHSAIERGAKIWALLTGWGMSNDAFHPTAPDSEGKGLAESMKTALRKAGISAGQIEYVNAHGTGTFLNDEAEVKAYESVFAGSGKPIPISSTKSYFGHTLGAAGAIEAVISIISLYRDMIPPTLRLRNPIESKCIDWVMDLPVLKPLQIVMSVSAGFGGNNTSLIFERWDSDVCR